MLAALGIMFSSTAAFASSTVACVTEDALINSVTAVIERQDKTVLDKAIADGVCGLVDTDFLHLMDAMGYVRDGRTVIIGKQAFIIARVDDGENRIYFLIVPQNVEAGN